jgi:hypothetical protein
MRAIAFGIGLVTLLALAPRDSGAAQELLSCSVSGTTCTCKNSNPIAVDHTVFSVSSLIDNTSSCTFYVTSTAYYQLGLHDRSSRHARCDGTTLPGSSTDTVLAANLNVPANTRKIQCTTSGAPTSTTCKYENDVTACI